MAGFTIGSKFKAFIDGLEIVAGKVDFKSTGKAKVVATTVGQLFAFTEGESTAELSGPVLTASPMELAELGQRLAAAPALFVVFDVVNARTHSCMVGVSGGDLSFSATDPASESYSLVTTTRVSA